MLLTEVTLCASVRKKQMTLCMGRKGEMHEKIQNGRSDWSAAEAHAPQQRRNDHEHMRQCNPSGEASSELKGRADRDEA
jgi:hypothetical protein